MISIGIDPPKGWAVADRGYIVAVGSCKTLSDLYRWLSAWKQNQNLKEVVIEIPHGLGSHLGHGMPVAMQRKISANIGQVYQSAIAIQAYCQAMDMPARLQKSSKWLTKINAERFQEITGYRGKTNEHGRDAAMLIYKFIGAAKKE